MVLLLPDQLAAVAWVKSRTAASSRSGASSWGRCPASGSSRNLAPGMAWA